jgi:hypothetical protein
MNAAVVVDWMARTSGRHADARAVYDQVRAGWLERENSRLAQENRRLREANSDLEASAELWIRLYEAALARCRQITTAASNFPEERS